MTVRELNTIIATLRHLYPFDLDEAQITWVYDPASLLYNKIVITIQEGPAEIKLTHSIKEEEVKRCNP